MNICKTCDGLLRTAFRNNVSRSRLAPLGSLHYRERNVTLIPKTEPRHASSWSLSSTAGPTVRRINYYSQDVEQSLELQNPSKPMSPSEPPRPGKPEFFRQMNECSSPSDVLDLINNTTQTHWRLSNSLTRMWETTKKMSDDQLRYELKLMFEHQGFEELCHAVILEAPKMRTESMAYSLLALVRLGVPQRSRVVQTLLRVIQENLNSFDERSLSILAGVLEVMDSIQNVDALKQGIRLRLQKDISLIKNAQPLQSIMRAVGKGSSDELKRKLEKKALDLAKDFTLPNAQYMLATMAIVGLNSRPLLKICSQKIEENILGISFTSLMIILKACQDLQYRNSSLLSSIAEYVATSCAVWSNKEVNLLLSKFERLHFHPTNLMDVYAEQVIQNPNALTLKDIRSVLKAYSSFNHDLGDHRQQFLDGITGALEAHLDQLKPDTLLEVIHFFCKLQHFPIVPLERLLQEDTLKRLLHRDPDKKPLVSLEQKLHAVDVCLRLDQTGLSTPLSVPPVLSDFQPPPYLPPPPALLSMLKSLEGVEAVEEHLVVDKIYHIDFLISPSSKSSRGDGPLQDQPPQKLAVLCAHSSAYCFGTSRLRGKMAMQMRHLQILGYSPVLVPVLEWSVLPEEQRLDMLKRLVFPAQAEPRVENTATVNSVE